jgi:chromate reductase
MLLREAIRLFGPAEATEANLRLPLYDGDLEEAEGIPREVQLLSDQIAEADAVIIAGPEYNKAMSGVLKNALDWVSRTKGGPWRDKPVAILSVAAGRAGGERTQMTLRHALVAFRPHVLPGPEVMIAGASDAFDDNGRLIDPRSVEMLAALMGDLRSVAEMRRGA